MRFVGIKFDKISAERTEEPTKDSVTVNSNFNLGKVEKEKINTDSKKPIFGFEFTYSMEYDKFAAVVFKGKIFLEIEDKEMTKELEKSGTIQKENKELRKFILDVVLARTHVEALHLEEKLGLPFHVQSPKVSFEKN